MHHFWLTPNRPSFHGLLRGFTSECKNCVPCFKVTHLSQCRRIHVLLVFRGNDYFLPLRFQILLMTASEITLASSSAVCGCVTLQAVTSCDAGRGVPGSHLRVVTITAVSVCALWSAYLRCSISWCYYLIHCLRCRFIDLSSW